MKHHDNQRNFKDPVCGMEVSFDTATEEFEYQGKMYYFCAPICRERFEATPEAFVRQHRQHGMRAKER